MRVVHLITSLSTHGAQMMLYKLLSRMDREQFDPVVISMRDGGPLAEKIEALGVPVHEAGINLTLPNPASLWRLIRLVRYLRPDVIQGWMYHANLAAQVVGALNTQPVPVVWNIRGSSYVLRNEKPLTAATIWLGAKLSKLPAKIINNSKVSAGEHEKRLAYSAEKRLIIPNGFDTDIFTPSTEARISVRSELGLAEDALLIGLVARYHTMKDHANFLRAASVLLKAHPQVHFVLAGEGVDTHNKKLLELINSFGLSAQVHLIGERSDTARVTAALDIASSSSAFGEGFPNVVGEAMACGVPCVVTDVGDSGWIVGETGRVVPPRDATALAKAWQELIEMSDEQRLALGKKARQRVLEEFSLDAVVSQYEALYEQVGSRKTAEKPIK
jgi:glycosyltransferase involved in cell wall biosynthesis